MHKPSYRELVESPGNERDFQRIAKAFNRDVNIYAPDFFNEELSYANRIKSYAQEPGERLLNICLRLANKEIDQNWDRIRGVFDGVQVDWTKLEIQEKTDILVIPP